MIEKKITAQDGQLYTVGFKEIGSNKEGVECHILDNTQSNRSIHSELYLKGISPDYKQMVLNTIRAYNEEQKGYKDLIAADWV